MQTGISLHKANVDTSYRYSPVNLYRLYYTTAKGKVDFTENLNAQTIKLKKFHKKFPQ